MSAIVAPFSSVYDEMDATPLPPHLVALIPASGSSEQEHWVDAMITLMDGGMRFSEAIQSLSHLSHLSSKSPKDTTYNGKGLWGDIMMDDDPVSVTCTPVSDETWSPLPAIPRTASSEAVSFGQGVYPTFKAPNCRSGNMCADPNCTYFHGARVCDFHAGKNTDNRRRLPDGKNNPNFNRPMVCGKGCQCPFDHRRPEIIASSNLASQRRARSKAVPVIYNEMDMFAAFPSVDWLAADFYDTSDLSDEDRELFIQALEKSPDFLTQEMASHVFAVDTPIQDSRHIMDDPVTFYDWEALAEAVKPLPVVVAAEANSDSDSDSDDDFILSMSKNKPLRRY